MLNVRAWYDENNNNTDSDVKCIHICEVEIIVRRPDSELTFACCLLDKIRNLLLAASNRSKQADKLPSCLLPATCFSEFIVKTLEMAKKLNITAARMASCVWLLISTNNKWIKWKCCQWMKILNFSGGVKWDEKYSVHDTVDTALLYISSTETQNNIKQISK